MGRFGRTVGPSCSPNELPASAAASANALVQARKAARERLGARFDVEMLRAVRLVVDTGIHAQGWSRERALAYMSANTSMAARDVAVEIDRYIAIPGQATAYRVSELKINQVLMTGALPPGVLEAKIDGWIADGGPAVPAG